MAGVVLVKKEEAGFAYPAHEKVIKIEMHKLLDGWCVDEQSGTRGGTLTRSWHQTAMLMVEANTAFDGSVAAAGLQGFVQVPQR